MKNKGSDEECFSDCWMRVQRNLSKLKLTEGDSLEVYDGTPMYNPLGLPLSN